MQATALADQLQSRGQAQQAQQVHTQQVKTLASANQALDQLAIRVKDTADLVNSLKVVA
jgi:hypothetical protein